MDMVYTYVNIHGAHIHIHIHSQYESKYLPVETEFSFRRTKNVTFSHHFGTLNSQILAYIFLPTFFRPLFSDHFFRPSNVICCMPCIFLFSLSNYFKIKIHMPRPGFEPGTSYTSITRSTNATVQSYFDEYQILNRICI